MKRLENYQQEFDADVNITIQNIQEKSLTVSSLRSKWIRYHFVEKQLLDKLKTAKTIYSRKIAQTIANSAKFATISAEQDPKLVKINDHIKQTEYCLEFIDKAFNVLDTFNFQIKNVVDLIKLEIT